MAVLRLRPGIRRYAYPLDILASVLEYELGTIFNGMEAS
jgi:hypothetical protein